MGWGGGGEGGLDSVLGPPPCVLAGTSTPLDAVEGIALSAGAVAVRGRRTRSSECRYVQRYLHIDFPAQASKGGSFGDEVLCCKISRAHHPQALRCRIHARTVITPVPRKCSFTRAAPLPILIASVLLWWVGGGGAMTSVVLHRVAAKHMPEPC